MGSRCEGGGPMENWSQLGPNRDGWQHRGEVWAEVGHARLQWRKSRGIGFSC